MACTTPYADPANRAISTARSFTPCRPYALVTSPQPNLRTNAAPTARAALARRYAHGTVRGA